jgi:glycosyltransferase involved in cell wall biosynthesis
LNTVAFIDETAKLGGAEINLLRILPRLQKAGWRPVVLLPEEGPLTTALRDCAVAYTVVPARRFHSISFNSVARPSLPNPFAALATLANGCFWALDLVHTLRRLRPDLVQTGSLLSHLFGGWAGSRVRVPVVAHVQDLVARTSGLGLWRVVFRWWAYGVPARLVCVSPLVADQFQYDPEVAHKTLTILNMVDRGEPCNATALRETGPWRIGTIARLARWKGQHVALAVAAELLRAGLRFKWSFVGDAALGDQRYERYLHSLARELQLEANVEFVGWLDDPHPFYASLDVLVHLPTEPEPFGLVIAEALACGVPVVTSHGGLDAVVNEAGGKVVQAGDSHSAALAIMDVLGQADAMSDASRIRAHATAKRYFAPAAILGQWTGLYEDVLSKRPRQGN